VCIIQSRNDTLEFSKIALIVFENKCNKKVFRAMPADVRKGSAFPFDRSLDLEALPRLPAAAQGRAFRLRRGTFTGKAQPFRTSGGTAAIVTIIFQRP
jgi:hypothetical protein